MSEDVGDWASSGQMAHCRHGRAWQPLQGDALAWLTMAVEELSLQTWPE